MRSPWFRRGVTGVIIAACLFFVVRTLVRSWDEVRDAVAGASVRLLILVDLAGGAIAASTAPALRTMVSEARQ